MFPYTYLWYIKVSNYKLLVAVGFIVALLYVIYRAHKKGFIKEQILDLGIICIICGFLGSKLFYILIEVPSEFWIKPWKLMALWEGGFVLYGGLICSIAACWFYAKKKQLSLGSISDLFTPAVALGIGIGRFACLAWGCCYGKIHAGFFSSVFPDYTGFSTDTPKYSPLYPTQLLMILNGFFIFSTIILLEYLDTKGKFSEKFKKLWDFSGTRAIVAVVMYSLISFFIEFLRADYRGLYVFSLSPSQWISILLVVVLVPLHIIRFRRATF